MAHLSEIAREFLKLGATAYGGPATIGIMQAELQEKRQWVTKPRFVEGLSIANLLPGATATQPTGATGSASSPPPEASATSPRRSPP